MINARLNAATRDLALQALAEETFDLIVVGGGVTGAGVALDAATRGLSVALVEAKDLASGTSAWSSKMVHGGLRYLATYQFGIARESAKERDHLMRTIAPHLVRPRKNLLPILDSMSSADVRLTRVGLQTADALRRLARTPSRLLPHPTSVSREVARSSLPAWKSDTIRGGLVYWDGEVEDDARLVLDLARTAASYGARIATYTRALNVGDHDVELVDELSGKRFTAHARAVVVATGVWAHEFTDAIEIVPSRGTHLVVEAERVGSPQEVVTIPVPGERGRYVFFKPAPDGLVHIGLTDVEAPGADGWNPGTPDTEVDELLAATNAVLSEPLDRSRLAGMFGGLRPLVRQRGRSSADTSRDHIVVDRAGEPIVVTGGKLTTYRAMAEEAVDVAARRLEQEGVTAGKCRTTELPLVGAASPAVLAELPESQRLVRRYGTLAGDVDALMAEAPELRERAVPGSGTTMAELVYGVLAEGAMTVDDLVDRRARLTLRRGVRGAATEAGKRAFEWAGVAPAQPQDTKKVSEATER